MVPGDILELGHVGDKMGIQVVMGPQLWFFNSGCVGFANIPDLSICFFYLLCCQELFTEESESEEDVTDDSPRGLSDNWFDETSEMSRHHKPKLSQLSFL